MNFIENDWGLEIIKEPTRVSADAREDVRVLEQNVLRLWKRATQERGLSATTGAGQYDAWEAFRGRKNDLGERSVEERRGDYSKVKL